MISEIPQICQSAQLAPSVPVDSYSAPGGVPISVVRVIARPDRSTSTWTWHRGCS